MYINLFWIGVTATLLFELGILFLMIGIQYFKGKTEEKEI